MIDLLQPNINHFIYCTVFSRHRKKNKEIFSWFSFFSNSRAKLDLKHQNKISKTSMHYNILECRLLFLIKSERVIFLFGYPSVQHHLRIFPRVERWQRSEDFHTVTRKSVLFLHHHSHHLKQRQSLLLCHFVGSDIKTYSYYITSYGVIH